MLDLAVKNISRQRTRTSLTVLGIVIGIAAIVALGSFSEGLNVYMQNSLEIIAGKIMIQEKGVDLTSFAGSDITQEQVDLMEETDGVKEVVPMNYYVDMEGGFGFDMSFDNLLVGIEPDKYRYLVGETIEIYDGRDMDEGETGVVILGNDVSENKNLRVGDYVTVKETEFEIVGVLERIGDAEMDSYIIANLYEVQDLLGTDTFQMVMVIPEDITNSEGVAENIEDEDEGLDAITSTEMARMGGEIIGQIRIFTLGIGGVAAFVGGLGVLNTMIMAVMERRREIGVMKAIGATKRIVLKQILTESLMISLIGGLVGLALGSIGSIFIGMMMGGMIPAIVTVELAAGSIIFALTLGLVGGVYPAMKAANLDPVEALRYE
jgi:putative ABC transport system permease protein